VTQLGFSSVAGCLIRLGVGRTVSVELTERFSQPSPTVTTIHPRLRQFVATPIPVLEILGSVDRFGLPQDLIDNLAPSHRRPH
jgi:hypothetical protein